VWAFAQDKCELIELGGELLTGGGSINWPNVHPDQRDSRRELHKLLELALHDFDKSQFNTVVAACMKIMNLLSTVPRVVEIHQGKSYEATMNVYSGIVYEGFSILLRLLSPIAPHITHILWRELGYGTDILTRYRRGCSTCRRECAALYRRQECGQGHRGAGAAGERRRQVGACSLAA